MPDDILIVFVAFDLPQSRILELAIFLQEYFGGLIISITVSKRSGRQKRELMRGF